MVAPVLGVLILVTGGHLALLPLRDWTAGGAVRNTSRIMAAGLVIGFGLALLAHALPRLPLLMLPALMVGPFVAIVLLGWRLYRDAAQPVAVADRALTDEEIEVLAECGAVLRQLAARRVFFPKAVAALRLATSTMSPAGDRGVPTAELANALGLPESVVQSILTHHREAVAERGYRGPRYPVPTIEDIRAW
mgnify:CR=1 FL=1